MNEFLKKVGAKICSRVQCFTQLDIKAGSTMRLIRAGEAAAAAAASEL